VLGDYQLLCKVLMSENGYIACCVAVLIKADPTFNCRKSGDTTDHLKSTSFASLLKKIQDKVAQIQPLPFQFLLLR